MAQRLRENPFDALIVVLGDCGDDWLEKRVDELIEVELTLKEQAPLQAYYYAEGATAVPPDISPSTLAMPFSGRPRIRRLTTHLRNTPPQRTAGLNRTSLPNCSLRWGTGRISCR